MLGTWRSLPTNIKAHRSAAGAKGGFDNAIGLSRGGCTTKIDALTDAPGGRSPSH
jgi:hypothetical protein